MCMCLLTTYPITICVPDKHAEIFVHAYLKCLYATFDGSLTMITDNGKEFLKDLEKMAEELDQKHQFLSPYHPQ